MSGRTRPALALAVQLVVACTASAPPDDQTDSSSSATQHPEGPTMTAFSLRSGAFSDGGSIPRRHSCDGPDVSPELDWVGAPEGTAAFALIVDDPDARGFVHWVAFDVPGEQASLAEGASGGGRFGEGRNDFGRPGWGGPCPPSGTHRYVFELYALDRALGLTGTPTAGDVRRAITGHTLGSARLVGRYRRG